MEPQVAPYGSWRSPVTADEVFARLVGLGGIRLDGESLYWCELRPEGRTVVVRRAPDGEIADVTPAGYNARTRVHEYGGGEYLVADGAVLFSNFADQRLYRQVPGSEPQPLTPAGGLRYADAVWDRRRGRLIAVREDHTAGTPQPINTLVGIDLEGDPVSGGGPREKDSRLESLPHEVLVSGNDFYASPRLSPDGTRLAWLTWNHPNMPWDGTELWVGEFLPDGSIGQRVLVAGGEAESIFQPEWSPDGRLYLVTDRSGWWNLARWQEAEGRVEPIYPREAEFGRPQWVFGMSTYGFESAERLICSYAQRGLHHLAVLDTRSLRLGELDLPYTGIDDVRVAPGQVFFVGSSPTTAAELVHLDLATGQAAVVRRSRETTIPAAYFSVAQPIEFPTDGGLTAHGFYYPPQNPGFVGPEDERPPLRVVSHGGPTGANPAVLRSEIQYWTTRGFAVLDVNYGGSTGYGRAYRERLKGQWGIVDVADCVNGARYLVARGLVDGNRLAIAGGSAGGYTTLCALTFYDTFRAGASYFGVSDLEALARDTHKFESWYLDGLVGPYPERRDLYQARSPVHHTERLACPLILFQGLEDPVVPPSQAEMMVEAVRARKLPVAYVPFPGEQHGFRKAENSKRALEAELYFYSRVFAFDLAEAIEPVPIENL